MSCAQSGSNELLAASDCSMFDFFVVRDDCSTAGARPSQPGRPGPGRWRLVCDVELAEDVRDVVPDRPRGQGSAFAIWCSPCRRRSRSRIFCSWQVEPRKGPSVCRRSRGWKYSVICSSNPSVRTLRLAPRDCCDGREDLGVGPSEQERAHGPGSLNMVAFCCLIVRRSTRCAGCLWCTAGCPLWSSSGIGTSITTQTGWSSIASRSAAHAIGVVRNLDLCVQTTAASTVRLEKMTNYRCEQQPHPLLSGMDTFRERSGSVALDPCPSSAAFHQALADRVGGLFAEPQHAHSGAAVAGDLVPSLRRTRGSAALAGPGQGRGLGGCERARTPPTAPDATPVRRRPQPRQGGLARPPSTTYFDRHRPADTRPPCRSMAGSAELHRGLVAAGLVHQATDIGQHTGDVVHRLAEQRIRARARESPAATGSWWSDPQGRLRLLRLVLRLSCRLAPGSSFRARER